MIWGAYLQNQVDSVSLAQPWPITHFVRVFTSHMGLVSITFTTWFVGLKPSSLTAAMYLVWGGPKAMTHWGAQRAANSNNKDHCHWCGATAQTSTGRGILPKPTAVTHQPPTILFVDRLVCWLWAGFSAAVSHTLFHWLVVCLFSCVQRTILSAPVGTACWKETPMKRLRTNS